MALSLSLFLIILLSHLYIADFGLCLLGFFYPVEFLFLMDCSCDLSPSSVYLESLSHNFLCKEDQVMVLINTLFVQQSFGVYFVTKTKSRRYSPSNHKMKPSFLFDRSLLFLASKVLRACLYFQTYCHFPPAPFFCNYK